MIVFDLMCSDGHRFESWFRNGAAYDDQSQSGAIVCPVCGDTAVAKAPMRPYVARRGAHRADKAERQSAPAAGRPAAGSSAAATPAASPQAAAPEAASPPAPAVPAAAEKSFQMLRKLVEATCDDVGREFPEQARRIHYGETAPRAIFGEASAAEADALREEGIAVQPLPWMRRRHD